MAANVPTMAAGDLGGRQVPPTLSPDVNSACSHSPSQRLCGEQVRAGSHTRPVSDPEVLQDRGGEATNSNAYTRSLRTYSQHAATKQSTVHGRP